MFSLALVSGIVGFEKGVQKCPPPAPFGEGAERGWEDSPGRPSGPGLLTSGSTSSLVTDLFRFSISSGFSLGSCMFPRIYPFLLGCRVCWRVIVPSRPQHCYGSSCTLAFISGFELSLFLVCRPYLSKEPAFHFVDLSCCLFSLYFICF